MGLHATFVTLAAAVFAAALAVLALQGAPPNAPAPRRPLPPPLIVAPDADDLPDPPAHKPLLPARLGASGFALGQPVHLRLFKYEAVLEVWLKRGAVYEKFDVFPICYFSGVLGPKQREGDFQAPEGFYEVGAKQLNPNSAYHLAFNLGFPNAYDRSLKRTGSALMVHGNCASVGCYAMTDYGITEIYALVAGALKAGQRSVPVHIFPFRMTDAAMDGAAGHGFLPFWKNLKEGYDAFEATRLPPAVYVCGERYAFGADGTSSCARVAAW